MNDTLLTAGDILDGRYVVTGPIGSGAFAEVYLARQMNLDRPVAIKVLHIQGAKRDADRVAKRFELEARVAAKIQHPCAVTIFDTGTTPTGLPYIVLEYLQGMPLSAYLAEHGPLPISKAVTLMLDCLQALEIAHSMDIIHRDLKPENLFLVAPGMPSERLVVLDFGLAFTFEKETARLTKTGHITGTPRYVAPEYIRDNVVSSSMDVYSLGLTLVEMVTGKAVVNDETPYACFIRHATGDLKIPRVVLRSPLGPLIGRAVALQLEDRIPDAAVFREELERTSIALHEFMNKGDESTDVMQLESMARKPQPTRPLAGAVNALKLTAPRAQVRKKRPRVTFTGRPGVDEEGVDTNLYNRQALEKGSDALPTPNNPATSWSDLELLEELYGPLNGVFGSQEDASGEDEPTASFDAPRVSSVDDATETGASSDSSHSGPRAWTPLDQR